MTVLGRSTALLLAGGVLAATSCARHAAPVRFTVTVPSSARADALTGRVFVVISRDSNPEPRLNMAARTMTTPYFGVDVKNLAAGQLAMVDDTTTGYLVNTPRDIPAGDYYVQAVVNVYTEFHRADGHTLWAHMDQWEGQHLTRSPGNLYSPVTKVHLDPTSGFDVALQASQVIPPVEVPPDTKWVKRIKIQSDILTKFWGHPMFLGATVLLPQGYDEHPAAHYPVLYEQGHFSLAAPMGFTTDSLPAPTDAQLARQREYNVEPGYAFYHEWTSAGFPKMLVITFQHPTPYFDDSYAVNSANNGPYGDAIMQELIPYLESHYRIIAKPYARVLSGGSTGGWESLALQLYHPDFFGGTWTLYPDPIDFHHYGEVDAYADTNAFIMGATPLFTTRSEWLNPPRYFARGIGGQAVQSMAQLSRLEDVKASNGLAAEQLEIWEAVYGPVGADGYTKPLWDKRTGHIDHEVANYMRDHGYDLTAYVKQNWATLGPKLAGKIHIDCGDMDNYFLNLAVMDMQAVFDSSKAPHVTADIRYGRPLKGHGWQHTSNAGLLHEMAAAISAHAPAGESSAWKY
jgi:Putative esterase